MKGYIMSEESIRDLVSNVRSAMSDYRVARMRDEEIAKDIIAQMSGELIELNDISVSEVNVPCKYYVRTNIVGFVQKDGILRGVFIKE